VTPSTLGLQVQEERGPDQTIARLGTARTAFVGRTLRGPVNRPVLIKSFAEFQHVFGGLWQPSPWATRWNISSTTAAARRSSCAWSTARAQRR
jgi:hypothetical protein